MTVAHWQQFVVIVLVVAAAGSLVRRAWHAFVGADPGAAAACDRCPATLTKDSTTRRRI